MKRIINFGITFSSLLLAYQHGVATHGADTSEQHMTERKRSISIFPIFTYDSDIGFGFGSKGMVKNQFKGNESIGLVLFTSTKGEQWYELAISVPDFEIRHGTAYPWAFDLKLEYDKYLKSNFFGFGNNSNDNDWHFPREMSKLELTVGRAITTRIIGEIGLLCNHTSVYNYERINPLLTSDVPGIGEHLTCYLTTKFRYDTRDSPIHPCRGWEVSFNSDVTCRSFFSDFSFRRFRLKLSKYQKLVSSSHVLAVRLWVQDVEGIAPYYEQSIIGGGRTARGFKADRFIDEAMTLISTEYRFLLYRRIGGVLFIDAGRVYRGIQKVSFQSWKANWGWGLRYYLAAFVVRFDTGISSEGTRIFFNFGHAF